jgi:hypothetical protein
MGTLLHSMPHSSDALLDRGDLDGQAVWKRIRKAIEELQNREPDGVVH